MPFIGNQPAKVPLTSADITDGIITSAKIADSTIGLADLSATGTKNATTFLRGDNTWGAVSTSGTIVSSTSDVYTGGAFYSYSTSFVQGSSSFAVTVTPASTANKILIICSFNAYNASDGSGYANFTLYRNSTNLGDATYGMGTMDLNDGTVPATIHYLDSPSSTSALTYSLYIRTSGTGGVYVNNNNGSIYITALEIKG